MKNIVFYDTSNFIDFPIGGQLTSIGNFLRYVAEKHASECNNIFLVGVTTDKNQVGKIQNISIAQKSFKFLPVLYRNLKLNDIKKSMRIEYLKGLFKYRKYIPSGKNVLHFLHTPEAFIEVKICHPFAKTAIFSHGSFFNMVRGFRFYKNNKFVEKGFNIFIKWMIKKANIIFTLDQDSIKQYKKYNRNLISVNNSIILPEKVPEREYCHAPIRLLFVGRLSKVKHIDGIIAAVSLMGEETELTILGDGEERDYLQNFIKKEKVLDQVHLVGAVLPCKVQEYMKNNDILVMNSILEGKPMTIIEAMSYGMPIITTNVGGISELLENNVEGIFTDGSTEGIVEAIKVIRNNYKQMCEQAVNRSLSYNYIKINDQVWYELNKI